MHSQITSAVNSFSEKMPVNISRKLQTVL